jgi:CheY-like chemotaxis protein
MTQMKRTGAPQRLIPASAVLRERDERLEALVVLASRLAHDFNNYLSPIIGYVSLIKEEHGTSPTVLQYASAMEGSARKAEGVISQVLAAARPHQKWQAAEVDFRHLIETETSEWQKSLPAQAGISVHVDCDACTLYLDSSQWRLVIQQLLRNARFALATGGTLKVSLHPEKLAPKRASELGIATPHTYKLVFEDNGLGMSETTRRRAFEPFFSTRPKSQALGLGLSVSYAIVRFHGGQIILEGSEDGGTRVSIWLPATADEEGPSREISLPRGLEPRHALAPVPKSVLLVSDDPLLVEVIRWGLQKAGFELLVANETGQSVKIAKRHPDEVKALLIDTTTPQVDPLSLSAQFRRMKPSWPLILLAGANEVVPVKGDGEKALGSPRIVKRPFELKGLIETVERLAS